jgi:DHA1 family multidrug resistance protein-like MFS transporter
VVLFVEEDKRSFEKSDAPKTPFFQGLRQAAMAPALLAMVGAIFAVQFGQTVVFPILPQFVQVLQGAAGHAASVTGFILAAAGIAGAAASLTSGFLGDRLGYKRVLVVAASLAAVLSIPQFFVTATWQMFVLRVGIGLSMGAIMPSATALIATLVPPEKRGTAYGLTGSANALGFSAGPMTAAVVVGVSGIRTVFLTAAVVLGLIALWVGLMVHLPQAQLEVAEEEEREAHPAEPVRHTGPSVREVVR